MNDAMRARLELRRSSAATPHRNRHREQKTGQAPWQADDFHDWHVAEEGTDDE